MCVEKYTKYDNFISTGLWKDLGVEILIAVIVPYPFLNGFIYYEEMADYDITLKHEINDILLFFSFNRLYLILKFILYLTEFMNPRSQRVCSMNGC